MAVCSQNRQSAISPMWQMQKPHEKKKEKNDERNQYAEFTLRRRIAGGSGVRRFVRATVFEGDRLSGLSGCRNVIYDEVRLEISPYKSLHARTRLQTLRVPPKERNEPE